MAFSLRTKELAEQGKRLSEQGMRRSPAGEDAAGHLACGVILQENLMTMNLNIPYPPEILQALQKEPDEFEAEARLLLAVKLYELGRLSSGLAAKLAGVPRTTFLFLLGQHGLSPFGEEPDELERDLENAQRANASPEGATA
jgi:predicted HTH domain antitoxin